MQARRQHWRMSTFLLMQNKLGGGEGIEGLYGSLTRTGMQKVLHSLTKSCGLDQTSRLVDIGAGLGRSELFCTAVCTSAVSVNSVDTALVAASCGPAMPVLLNLRHGPCLSQSFCQKNIHLSGHVYWRPLLKTCCNSMYNALEHAKTCWSKRMPQCYSTMVYLLITTCKRLAFCLQASFHITRATCAIASSCKTHQDTVCIHQAVHVPCSLLCTIISGSMHT